MATNFFDRHRFARRIGALAALIIVHAVLLGSGWVLAGEVGLLLAMAVVLVIPVWMLSANRLPHGKPSSDSCSSTGPNRVWLRWSGCLSLGPACVAVMSSSRSTPRSWYRVMS